MESVSEIIDSQSFSRQLVEEATDLISVGYQESGGRVVPSAYEKRAESLERQNVNVASTLITTIGDNQVASDDEEEPNSVVMVIDGMRQSSMQLPAAYQIVPQQLQSRSIPLPLSIPLDHGRQESQTASSPDFGGSDITLDTLAVASASGSEIPQIVAVKQENKLVIVHQSNLLTSSTNIGGRQIIHQLDITSVGGMDDISSDGLEVTLNQHHQQLQQHQYGHRHVQSSEMLHHHRLQQPVQMSRLGQHRQQQHNGHGHHGSSHSEVLSVLVQSQGDDMDDDEDDDSQRHDVNVASEHLLSPALVVADNCLEHSTYQTLTSVNERISPPEFSPTSYATLTPIQPLPPISTMSDKFAYAGHISGGSATSSSSVTGGSNGASGSANDCGPFTGLPMPVHHQGPLGGLNLSGLGVVHSPYSSYDKLPSMISPPTHHYSSSPSHTLSGMVVSCDLHGSSVPSPVGCGPLSPQSELHSPQHNGHGQGHKSQKNDLQAMQLEEQVICLSPTGVMTDRVVVSDYESSYSHHPLDQDHENDHDHNHNHDTDHELISASRGGRTSQLGLQHSPTLSPHSVSAGSVLSMSMSLHSPSGCSVVGGSHVASLATLPHMNGSLRNLSTDLPVLHQDSVVVSLTPTPPLGDTPATLGMSDIMVTSSDQQQQQLPKNQITSSECNPNDGLQLTGIATRSNRNVSGIISQQQIEQHQQQQHPRNHQNGYLSGQQKLIHQVQKTMDTTPTSATETEETSEIEQERITATTAANAGSGRVSGGSITDMEEINTKELAQRISAELKRYSIPQAIFAQRVLCRSQGTLSDLLRNPKPWSKLKSGRETFRRMFKWLQEPEFQRMSALRMAAAQIPQRGSSGALTVAASVGSAGSIMGTTSSTVSISGSPTGSGTLNSAGAVSQSMCGNGLLTGSSGLPNCRRKEEPHIEQMPQPKKPRLVFTDLQRRTLQAIFKETKRPSKEMQVTIARQLGLEPTTVGNFFMNARRRSMDKWRDDDAKNLQHGHHRQTHSHTTNEQINNCGNYSSSGSHHTTALSPLSNQQSQSLDFDEDDGDMDMEMEHDDFDLGDDPDESDDNEDML